MLVEMSSISPTKNSTFQQKQIKVNKQIRDPQNSNSYVPLQKKAEQQLKKIFRQFSFQSITFYLFIINCINWLSVHIIYYGGRVDNWDCVQFIFFAKFQPSITYQFQIWRLLLSSFMFRGWIQFYFNNFALNMMGYVIQKQSKWKFIIIFYGGILAGHMLSCCLSRPNQLTVGTSCGTIALLPIQICRYIKLRRTNPIQAASRLKFLIFNIGSNFILNVLAIFHFQPVDWISHIGCIIAGLLFLIYYQMKQKQEKIQSSQFIENWARIRTIVIRYASIVVLVFLYIAMGLVIWLYLPQKGIGKAQLQQINFLCNQNI